MSDIEAVLQRIAKSTGDPTDIPYRHEIFTLIDCARALDGMDGFFRSGNPIPIERATIYADHQMVVRMKDALKRLGEL